MLNILGQTRTGYCDGVTRRDFLKIGGLALGGLSLPGLLRAEGQAGIRRSHKAVIMIFLAGGPPHQDMFDLKPEAADGIRGEFRPIPTSVPGLEICEHMPRLARMMDKFVVIRSLVGAGGDHSAGQCMTGYKDLISKAQGGRPSLGAIVSRLQGPVHPDVPSFVGLSPRTGEVRWSNPGDPGYLDPSAITPTRLASRRSLLGQLDGFRRAFDHDESVRGMDSFTQRAFEVLASRKVYEALDVSREDPRVRARYGVGDMTNEQDGPPCCMDHFLMARRLVEAGARVVTIGFGRWDTHKNNFASNRYRLPKLDVALSALVEDLHRRGLERDVSVIVWGEFGRTPTINKQAGRDHWPAVNFALLAGGGMQTGQVIGSTDKEAAYVKDRPVSFQNVFATLYHNLGIDPSTVVSDRSGRPMTLLDEREPIREII
jgi:hypothetical protein